MLRFVIVRVSGPGYSWRLVPGSVVMEAGIMLIASMPMEPVLAPRGMTSVREPLMRMIRAYVDSRSVTPLEANALRVTSR